jgi:hypothetical protein
VPEVQVSYFIYFCWLLLPMLGALLINFWILKKRKQADAPV